ncbi:MAG TPA: GNAT family N-acetyltransferase [Anaerolineales bacterium]|nr:GNAT family N-acetyltransferase [Anaerolineales bacterium]
MPEWTIRLLETPEEMAAIETLQGLVWRGPDLEIVPKDILLAVVHNGGLAIGAFVETSLVGAVFGFAGFYPTPDGPRLKHHSHLLAVHPDWRSKGLGFALKRAQWQMVRKQGIDRITWTYDPLLSRNAHLNIARLGAVCNTYLRSAYGEMQDSLNAGLPSDRFQVDWWLNTRRVERRLSRRARPSLTLEHFLAAEANLLAALTDPGGLPHPPEGSPALTGALLLVEIPSDLFALKKADLPLARDWRFYSREIFEEAFTAGYLATDFVYDRDRSFYVLTHGETTL